MEALILSNVQRVKTNEQVGREAQALWDIEEQRAKARQQAALKQNQDAEPVEESADTVPVLEPERSEAKSDNGDTRDKVAAKLGKSGKHVEQAKKVMDSVDDLEENGKADEAAKLKKELNQNAKKAHKTAVDNGLIKTAKPKAEP